VKGDGRRPPVLAMVLFAVSAALWAVAIYNIVRMVSKGYTYACVGQGCPYQTPAVAGELRWMSISLPFAIITLVGAILALQFRGSRSTGPTSWDQIPMLASAGWGSGAGAPWSVSGGALAATTSPDKAARLRASGVDGTATITSLHDGGMSAGNTRLFEIGMRVSAPDRPPYDVTHATYVPAASLGRLFQGGTYPVKIDPNDPNDVLLDLQ
jgi:hypothetical protein